MDNIKHTERVMLDMVMTKVTHYTHYYYYYYYYRSNPFTGYFLI